MRGGSEEPRIEGVAGVVLAGGAGKRMGGVDKALLPFRGRPLVSSVLDLFQSVFEETLLVVARSEPYLCLGVPLALDRLPGEGPLAGLETALSVIRSERAFVAACDMPRIAPSFVRLLVEFSKDRSAAVPLRDGRPEPLHAVYSREARHAAREAIENGERKMSALLSRIDWRRVEPWEYAHLMGAEDSLLDLDSPEDLARALGGG